MAMEQIGKYWGLWSSTRSSSSEPSWEEQAFARDTAAAAHLGGCVWPPCSYSCSFCQREFRSAQALGGHMNVHRRDRALLRQRKSCSSPDDDNGQQEAASGREQPKPQGPLFCRAARCSSNPSTTTTTTAFPAAKGDVNRGPAPSYLASIIKESKNKRLFMSMGEEVMDQYVEDQNDEESGRMKRRRLLDPPLVAVSMVAASESQGLQGIVDPDAKVTTKTIISSPSSMPPLPQEQQVDLELRLGTTPKVT